MNTPFKTRQTPQGQVQIFDAVRKKYVALTPEEYVRQQVLHYLMHDRGIPLLQIGVEKALRVVEKDKRTDIVVYDPLGKVRIIVECKASTVRLGDAVYEQIARYNYPLGADYLMITNGVESAVRRRSPEGYVVCEELPLWPQLMES